MGYTYTYTHTHTHSCCELLLCALSGSVQAWCCAVLRLPPYSQQPYGVQVQLLIDGICRCVHAEGPRGPYMAPLKHTETLERMGVGVRGWLVSRGRC